MAPRVLVGTNEIAGNVYNVTKGFRQLGLEADSLVVDQSRHRFYTEARYTITNLDHLEGVTYAIRPDGTVAVNPSKRFIEFVQRYDVFVFVSSASLLPRLVDLPLLKQMGKTVIARQCGTEVRDTELAKVFWDDYGFEYPFYAKDKATPKVRCITAEDILLLTRYHPALANKTHNTRMGELFADAITSGAPSQTLAARPYFQTGPPLDGRDIACAIPKRRRPVIVHAPSSKEYKRTDVVLSVLRELEAEGLGFDLKLLHEVPHQEVLRTLRDADILIDDLSCGAGMLAYEGAAAGCVVLGGHDGVSSTLPRHRPVLHTTVETLKEQAKRVIMDVDYRARLARRSRDFIDQAINTPARIAEYLLKAVERDKAGDADIYPTLFTQRGEIPPGETMPLYLKEMTLEVLKRHGVHPEVDLSRLAATGLLPKGVEPELKDIPSWEAARLNHEGPWITTGPGATFGADQAIDHGETPLEQWVAEQAAQPLPHEAGHKPEAQAGAV